MQLDVFSPSLGDRAVMPTRHTADGANTSPSVVWRHAPARAVEMVIIMEDLDAGQTQPWVHWVVFGIDPSLGGIPPGLPSKGVIESGLGVRHGCNSWSRDNIGYRGPAPSEFEPPHRYRLSLYALAAPTDLPPGASATEVRDAMAGDILAHASLERRYGRRT